MDLNYTPEEVAFRDEIRDHLATNLSPRLSDKIARNLRLTREDLVEWHDLLNDAGWLAWHWPEEWGGQNDKIKQHIMKSIPGGHSLFIQDKEVASKIENIYSKFKIMLLKKDDQSKSALLANLRKINDHLEGKGSRFLTGDTMCCFDCELMPKLQHIRVAGECFADFSIPGKY